MTHYTLITGASSGIGEDFARECAAKGESLILSARSSAKLESLANELAKYGVKIEVVPADLSQFDGPETLYSEIRRRGLHVHTLINNAGLGAVGLFHEVEWQRQEEMLQVNMRALTRLCHLFIPAMAERKAGRILNVASTAAFQPAPMMGVYFASKSYVLSFSEALAWELRDKGIVVSCLCPGPTATNFAKAAKVEKARLFQFRSVASSKDVARFGLRALEAGQRVAIEGLMNRVMAFLVPFIPRVVVLRLGEALQKSRH